MTVMPVEGVQHKSLWMPAILPLSSSAHAESLPALNFHTNNGLLCCISVPFLACAATLAMSTLFTVAITGACMSPCSYKYALTHPFNCRLTGNEGFRRQLLRRTGKLVLLTPPRPGAAVQEVADYLKPMLTVAAGGSLDAYRI